MPSAALRHRRSTLSPLQARLAAGYAVALITLLACLAALPGSAPAPSGLAGAAALLLATRLVRVPLRLGERRVLIAAYGEAAMLATLLLVPPPWVPLLVGGATLVGQLPRRLPTWRALFNVAAFLGPTGAMTGAYLVVTGGRSDLLSVAAGLLVAAPLISLLNLVAVTSVVAAAHGEPWLPTLRVDVRNELTGSLVQAALCVFVLAAWRAHQYLALLLLPLVGLALFGRVVRRLARVTEDDALPRLERASRHLATLDPDDALHELLQRAVHLFGVVEAVLHVPAWPGRGPRTWQYPSHGSPASAGADLQLELADLHGQQLGTLRLAFPRDPQLSAAERQVLTTFTATAATTLRHYLAYAAQYVAARTDELTGLGNRLELQERLAALPGSARVALALLDLDHFKQVNDTLGHGVGDQLLVVVGRRLTAALGEADVALRLGGDEFVVLLDAEGGERSVLARVDALLGQLNRPVALEGLELPIEASIGVALRPQHGVRVEELLRRADLAMYRAKRTRNAVVVHDPGDDAGSASVQLLGQLQSGLRLGEIEVHYQPVVDLASSEIVASEALVRWRHPDRGLLLPGSFIGAVEQTSLIVPLTLEVLDQAVAATAELRRTTARDLSVAVNLSPRCLAAADLAWSVLSVLATHGLPAHRLVLEITETLELPDSDLAQGVLVRLREAGVQLSVDDFGTGFSSMTFLRRVEVDEVKLDRSFVQGAVTRSADRAIASSTAALAHGLGVALVAEGVETVEQLRLVRTLGCQRAQGYLFGAAMPAPEFARLLRRPHAARFARLGTPG